MTTSGPLRPTGRYSSVNGEKSKGATYTPPELAQFVAEKMVAAWNVHGSSPTVRVLDPAAGEGELLLALVKRLRACHPSLPVAVFGFEPDKLAIRTTLERMHASFPDIAISLTQGDFLEHVVRESRMNNQLSFFTAGPPETYDLVIANPPYVRTQIMGASQAQHLARQFGLSGRIDLYYAFMLAIASVLKPEAISGMIVSNRFMTTRSGADVRRAILEKLGVLSIWDFGDTKLFGAAVLPAVVLARGTPVAQNVPLISFRSIYETTLPQETWASGPIEAISKSGVVEVSDGRRFVVRHGKLETSGKTDGVWRIADETSEVWLKKVAEHTWGTFRDIGRVRVGVKTCADKVFIRSDWAQFPADSRPELLRPIMTHHSARRFKAIAIPEPKLILYTHEVQNGYRKAIELSMYPRSAVYLEGHRRTLEARGYVTKSGRNWFEIWVPQDPAAWNKPKLVFRDIVQDPTFWVDLDGSVVNGDCYWLAANDVSESELLWLAAAVGNSSFIQRFYDYRFHNRLYAGRRRFMTQYVEQFPLPSPSHELGRSIIANAKRMYMCVGTEEGDLLEDTLNRQVWRAFGLPFEEIAR